MTAPLLVCPRCGRTGFYPQGLKTHNCRGVHPTDQRRRLTPAEIAKAYKALPAQAVH